MFNNIPPITKNIIIINVIVFVVVNFIFSSEGQLFNSLAGFYPFSPYFKSWQIITHMFMHAGGIHILFNMLTLFSFGPILEQTLGDKRYLILYFLSGLGAFFLFNFWNFIEVQRITSSLDELGFNVNAYLSGAQVEFLGTSDSILKQQQLVENLRAIVATPMVGASGAIFGVVTGFATLYPNAKIAIMFIPVPMKVKYLMPIVIAISIWLGISGKGSGVAHLAHVGGALAGWILARNWRKHLYRFN